MLLTGRDRDARPGLRAASGPGRAEDLEEDADAARPLLQPAAAPGPDPDEDGKAAPRRWPTLREFAAVAGPGLVVMLADSDAGCLLTAAATGSTWGYTLVPLQWLLVVPIVLAQELTARLGACTGRGLCELIRERYSAFWAWTVAAAVAVTCVGGLVSEVSGVVGVGRLYGVSDAASVAGCAAFLAAVVASGSYRRVEAVAVCCGLFELVYLYTAWLTRPTPRQLLLGDGGGPDRGTLPPPYMVSAQIGATLMPWMFVYGQSSVVERGLRPRDLPAARADCLVGGVLTQLVMAAVIVTAAGTVWDGRLPSRSAAALGGAGATVEGTSAALAAHLGPGAGRLLFSVGMLGGAAVGAIVTVLTGAWALGEVAGFSRSLERRPWPMLGALAAALALAAAACLTPGVDLMRLNVAIQVLNAAVTPLVLFFLYRLARTELPPKHAMGRGHRAAVLACFVACGALGLAGAGSGAA